MSHNDWRLYYFEAQDPHMPEKWTLLRKLGKEQLSEKAQLKLEWIIFYYTVGNTNATSTANHFGITRKTLNKYLKRFDEKNLLTLEEQSRRQLRELKNLDSCGMWIALLFGGMENAELFLLPLKSIQRLPLQESIPQTLLPMHKIS